MGTKLLTRDNGLLVLVDPQSGLAFGKGSGDAAVLSGNLTALARSAKVFDMPAVASVSTVSAYNGPVAPIVQQVLPHVQPIRRQSMNAWDDAEFRRILANSGRRRLLLAGLFTEACVTFPALSALEAGYDVYVVGDACGGLTAESHDLALRRLEKAGVKMTSWLQVLLELQHNWNLKDTYEGAHAILEEFGGGAGVGLWPMPGAAAMPDNV